MGKRFQRNMDCCDEKHRRSRLVIESGQTLCQALSAQRRFSLWGPLSMNGQSKPPDGLRIKIYQNWIEAGLFMVSPISTYLLCMICVNFKLHSASIATLHRCAFWGTVTIQLPNHHHSRPTSSNIKNKYQHTYPLKRKLWWLFLNYPLVNVYVTKWKIIHPS